MTDPRNKDSSPRFWRRFVRKPIGVIALAWIVIIVVGCVAAPWIAPAKPLAQNLEAAHQGPSAAHLLGTDSLGRDVLSRMLYGGQVTLLGVAEALVVGMVLGALLGLAAGFSGGATDTAISRCVDIVQSLPVVIILLAVLGVFSSSMTPAMIALGVVGSAGIARVIRSATIAVREEPYIDAARVNGLTSPRIVVRHVVLRIAGPLIVQATLFASMALLIQSGLSFLGLGVTLPAPSWGGMIEEASSLLLGDPWLIVPTGGVVAVTTLALVLLGDTLRDTVVGTWSAGRIVQASARTRESTTQPADTVIAPTATSGNRVATPLHDPSAVLSVRGLTVAMDRGGDTVQIVRGVDLDVRRGQTLGIVGETGCGKTMTVRALMGLLPAGLRTVAGEARLHGTALPITDDRAMRDFRGTKIGMIFQEPMASLDPAFRVGAQVAEVVRRHAGVSRMAAHDRAVELLRAVQLRNPEDVARQYPHQLSGGMAQRVGIARALASEPEVLIADEPTTALDVTVQLEILDLLRSLQEERDLAIVLVTHDWGVVAEACSDALVLYAGQVVERATVKTLFARPGHPYTAALMGANPSMAAEGEMLPTIVGTVPQAWAWPTGCSFAPRCKLATEECEAGAIPLIESADGAYRCIHPGLLEQAEPAYAPATPLRDRTP